MKTDREKIGKLQVAVLFRTILPVLVMCIAIDATAMLRAKASLTEELNRSLYATAASVAESYDTMYPGDYRLLQVGGGYVSLYKGDTELTEQFDFLDRMREKTGMHISLFFKDARILTTLQDEEGVRYAGSGINAAVSSRMERKPEPLYFEVQIGTELYYACYIPLWNSDGTLVGMMATAITSAEVKQEAAKASTPILVITVLGLLVAGFISVRYTSRVVTAIRQIHGFLAGMVTGNLSNVMPDNVLKRNDEIGQTGGDIVRMPFEICGDGEKLVLAEVCFEQRVSGKYSGVDKRCGGSQSPRYGDLSLAELYAKAAASEFSPSPLNDLHKSDVREIIFIGVLVLAACYDKARLFGKRKSDLVEYVPGYSHAVEAGTEVCGASGDAYCDATQIVI